MENSLLTLVYGFPAEVVFSRISVPCQYSRTEPFPLLALN